MTITEFCLNCTFEWVKSHQDRKTPFQNLPLPAQLNTLADEQAEMKHCLASLIPTEITPMFDHCEAQLVLGTQSIHGNYKRRLLEAEFCGPLRDYMCERRGWSVQLQHIVDWDAQRTGIHGHYDRRITIVKLIHDLLPTGKIAHRYRPTERHECPLCWANQEDWIHVLRCPHPSRQAWRETFLKNLRKHTTDLHTILELQHILLTGLENRLLQRPSVNLETYPDRYQPLWRHQTLLGWGEIFRGFMTLSWRDHILTSTDRKTSH